MDTLLRLACLVFFIVCVWPLLREGAREIRNALELNAYSEKDLQRLKLLRTLKPVSEYTQVLENIENFNREMASGAGPMDRLSSFRNWCYAPEIDMFAPRRYVSVAGADAQFYINAESEDLMRQGESALAEWFTVVPPDSKALGYLITKLRSRFPQARQPQARLRLYVPKGWGRDHAGQSTGNCH